MGVGQKGLRQWDWDTKKDRDNGSGTKRTETMGLGHRGVGQKGLRQWDWGTKARDTMRLGRWI